MIEHDPYITIEEAERLGAGDRATIYRRIDDGTYAVKPGEQKSANGRPQSLLRVASLPEAAQRRYWHEQLAPATEPAGADAMNLAEIPDSVRRAVEDRLDIVLAAEQALAVRRGDLGPILKAVASQRQVSERTLQRWVAAWRHDGLPGLLPKWGALRGRHTALDDEDQDYIKSVWLSPTQPSMKDVYDEYCYFYRKVRGKPDAPASLATVVRFLKTLPPPAVVLARLGPKAYRAQCELVVAGLLKEAAHVTRLAHTPDNWHPFRVGNRPGRERWARCARNAECWPLRPLADPSISAVGGYDHRAHENPQRGRHGLGRDRNTG